jgi:hypothetical protein
VKWPEKRIFVLQFTDYQLKQPVPMKFLHRAMPANERAFKAKIRNTETFEDLFDDQFQNMYFTETALLKAMPKSEQKVKKMKPRKS